MATLDLYIDIASPPCRAVLILIKLLGLDDAVCIHKLNLLKGEQLSKQFVKLNPLHTLPFLVDGKFTLTESRVIMTYLCNRYHRYSPLYPRKPENRARVDRILMYDAEKFAPRVHAYAINLLRKREVAPDALEKCEESFKDLENLMGENTYVAGDRITIADINLRIELHEMEMIQYDFCKFPKIKCWMERTEKALPFYKPIQKAFMSYLRELQAAGVV